MNKAYKWKDVRRVKVESDLGNDEQYLFYINRNTLRGNSGTLYEFNEGLFPLVREGMVIYTHWSYNTTPFEVVGVEV